MLMNIYLFFIEFLFRAVTVIIGYDLMTEQAEVRNFTYLPDTSILGWKDRDSEKWIVLEEVHDYSDERFLWKISI